MIKIFGNRHKKWPRIDIYSSGGRGDIKLLSPRDLEYLMTKAADKKWSAEGRPGWFRQQRKRIKRSLLVIFGIEEPLVYRCIVATTLDDNSNYSFTLDVAFDDFDGLPDVTQETLVTLAHLHLLNFPPLKLDPPQEDAWRKLDNPD